MGVCAISESPPLLAVGVGESGIVSFLLFSVTGEKKTCVPPSLQGEETSQTCRRARAVGRRFIFCACGILCVCFFVAGENASMPGVVIWNALRDDLLRAAVRMYGRRWRLVAVAVGGGCSDRAARSR